MIPAHQTGKATAKVKVNTKKTKAGTYEGTVIVREGGKTVAKVPTLLIVKEPDYPRVTSVSVSEGSVQGTYQIETHLLRERKSWRSSSMTATLISQAKPAFIKTKIKVTSTLTGMARLMAEPNFRPESITCSHMPRTKASQARF